MKKRNVILAALLAVPAYAAIRALCFVPPTKNVHKCTDFDCDGQLAGEHLGEMIRLKTVSHRDMSQMDMQQFDEFPRLIEHLYPSCAQTLSFERAGKTGLIYHWGGASSENAIVLMAHYDVVPAQEQEWSFPPFCGELRDDKVLGRGALDTKCTLCAIFEAVERLVGEGFVPKNDIYLCFSGTEEIAGEGAHEIVKLLAERSIHPRLTLDEGGAIVGGIIPGVERPCAIIGVAEKGQMSIRLSAKARPGHASTPQKATAVALLAQAICSVEHSSFDVRLTEPLLAMLDSLGRYAPFPYRLVYASPKLFLPLIKRCAQSFGGEVNAFLRTTTAFTRLRGSEGDNVLPAEALAMCDVRLLPGTSCAQVVEHFQGAVGGDIELELLSAAEPSASSPTSGSEWDILCEVIGEAWGDIPIAPYLMVARSDSSVYTKICEKVYRFAPIALTAEESATVHAADECIPVDKLKKAVEFYYRLIKKL